MPKVVAIFTNFSWQSVLPVLRLISPLAKAGFTIVDGMKSIDDGNINLSGIDIITIQRDFPKNWVFYRSLVAAAKQQKIPIIFDIDDLLWELPPNHPERKNSAYLRSLLPMLTAAAEADLVTVSTPTFLSYIKTINPDVRLLPYYINDDFWTFKKPIEQTDAGRPVVLGYIGSHTHGADLRTVLPVLMRLLEEYQERLLIRFIGCEIPWEIAQLPNVETDQTWSNSYADYASRMAKWSCDICIAPLEFERFNRAKSPLKFLEYSTLGIAGVYSRIEPYEWVVTHGENGFLASTSGEWYSSLKILIEQPDLRYKIAMAAQKTVKDDWLLSSHLDEWLAVYEAARPASQLDENRNSKIFESISEQFTEQQAQQDFLLQRHAQEAQSNQAISNELLEIKSSTAWQIIRLFWTIRLKIAPHGSYLERFAQFMSRVARAWRQEGTHYLIRQIFHKTKQLSQTGIHKISSSLRSNTPVGKQKNYSHPQNRNLQHLGDVINLLEKKAPNLRDIKVDIIVPVYNGFDFLPEFFKNLLANTSAPYRLIIIDDCSPDQRVWPYLQSIAGQKEQTVLMKNDLNMGFTASVNLGIQKVQSHFVILNTDAFVPQGWIDRLMFPIFSSEDVASTTPFTNSGTICSFPKFLKDNDLFDGHSFQEIDNVFGLLNPDLSQFEIPTGIGFCMGMNINVVQAIGSFDEKTFGRGYGEENDWCMRALKAGYRNLMVGNLFVYHKHGGSFSTEEKKELSTKNTQLLRAKHPDYDSLIQEFVLADPAAALRNLLLILLIDQKSEDGAVLIIDHELGGGANIYRETIERELNQKNIPILVYSERSPRKTGRFSIIYKGNNILLSTGSRDDVLHLAKHIKISSIHYNNSVSFPEPEQIASFLVDLKKISSGQLILAMHDFFIACPSPHFFNHEGKFCEIPPIDQCKICLPQNSYAVTTEPVDIQVWRALWGKCLQETDKILCFSESTAKLLCKAYPAIAIEKIEVKPHQVNYVAKYKPQLYLGPQMHIGVAGIIGPHKGALIVEKMAQIIHQKNIQAKIFVFGAYFGQQEDSVITVVGKYKPEELPDLIEKVGVSVFLFPTVVPETFSYTTQELMHLEVPIVAFNLGAPADRLSRYPLGKLVDKVDAEEALNALIMLHKQCLIELPDRYSVH